MSCSRAVPGSTARPMAGLMPLTPSVKGPIQVVCGADEGQMRKGLGEISQRLAAGAGLLRVQPQVVCVTEHPLENQQSFFQSDLIQPPRACERFDEPKGTGVECPFDAFESVEALFQVIAIDQTVGDQAALPGRFVDRVDSLQHPWV